MSERTTGLILRTRLFTETSLIVEWLTADFGRLSTVAKGARRHKSPFHGKLDLFYLAEFSFIRSRRSGLHTLCEISLQKTHRELRQEMAYLRQASYCAALLEQTTETEAPLPEVFALFRDLLDTLAGRPAQSRTIYAFELKLLSELGLEPDLLKTNLSPATRQLLRDLMRCNWVELGALTPAPAMILEIRQFLHGFLIYHLGKIPPGRNAALKSGARVAP